MFNVAIFSWVRHVPIDSHILIHSQSDLPIEYPDDNGFPMDSHNRFHIPIDSHGFLLDKYWMWTDHWIGFRDNPQDTGGFSHEMFGGFPVRFSAGAIPVNRTDIPMDHNGIVML